MADITTTVETKKTTRFRLTGQDVINLFRQCHPDFADQTAEIYAQFEHSLDNIPAYEYISLTGSHLVGDARIILVVTKTEVS